MPRVTVTRRLRFNAAHRVHNPELSDAENSRLFGKCNNPNWHGHNYTLDVSVEGDIDPKTGYVYDLSQLKKIVEREIIDIVDHKNFNLDVPFMKGVIPTSENIITAFWRILLPRVNPEDSRAAGWPWLPQEAGALGDGEQLCRIHRTVAISKARATPKCRASSRDWFAASWSCWVRIRSARDCSELPTVSRMR